jgi:hypothetical protein
MELGALEPLRSEQTDKGTAHEAQATVVQQHDETPNELAVRAVRRVDQLTREGMPLVSGVILVNGEVEPEAFEARCQIARAMIRGMRGARSARLLLLAPEQISDGGRHELLAIAGTLASQLEGLPVEVSVRFDRHPTSSPRARGFEPAPARSLGQERIVDVA